MQEHKTISDSSFQITEQDKQFNYQKGLTTCLDNYRNSFDQETINQIVLWKVNRFAQVDDKTLALINEIDINAEELDETLTLNVLRSLLYTKGIKLPMASTILRFRSPDIYQIIDQRVYRIIYPQKKLALPQYLSEKNFQSQVELYVTYLSDLRNVCNKLDIPFKESDRILYCADKRVNKNVQLENYGTRSTDAEYGK